MNRDEAQLLMAQEARRVLGQSIDILREPFAVKEIERIPDAALTEMIEALTDATTVFQERCNQLVAERVRRHWVVVERSREAEAKLQVQEEATEAA